MTVIANGHTLHVFGNQSSTPHANATASLQAWEGDIVIGGKLDVEALASSLNHDSVTARALAGLRAAGGIAIDGSVNVIANVVTDATHHFYPTASGARASAGLIIDARGGAVDLGALAVRASAVDRGNFQAQAYANADISAWDSVTIHGNAAVTAVALQTNANGGFEANGSAIANLAIFAGFGDVTVDGNIDVEARVSDHGKGNAVASALLDVLAGGAEGGGGIRVGDVTVNALADNWGGGRAIARALATFDASFGSVQAGNIALTANAHNFSGGGACSAEAASASAELTFAPRAMARAAII